MKLGTTLMSLWMNFRQVMGATGPPPSTLLNDLVSYWPLNEVSGTRYDVVGSNDLTDNNTVGAVLRGPEGTVASFVAANSEYLSDAGLVSDAGGGSFSWAAWIKNDPASANCSYAGQALDGLHVVRVYSDTGVGGRISTTVYNHPADVTASVTGYSGDSWRLIVGGYDSASQKTFISVNGAAKTVSANTSAMIANIQSVDFWIGRADYPGYSTMQSGASGFWDVVLTDEQITALFAAGNGLRYADLPAGLQTGLVSWWELDEVSGVRYDSHGSNDLTDNNTVGSATAVSGAMDGAAASFVAANSESLSTVALSGFSDISISAWFKTPASPSNYQGVFQLGEGDYAIGTTLIAAYLDANNTLAIENFNNDGVQKLYKTYATLPSSTWHFVYAEYDAASGVVSCSLDNSALTAGTAQGAAGPNALDRLLLGTLGGSSYFGSQIDEVAIWSRVLTEDERTELYALGRGRFYDFS